MRYTRKTGAFYNYELVGDDFFLNIAHLDCKQKLENINNKTGFKGLIPTPSYRYDGSQSNSPFLLKVVRLNYVACVFLVSPFIVSQRWSKQVCCQEIKSF